MYITIHVIPGVMSSNPDEDEVVYRDERKRSTAAKTTMKESLVEVLSFFRFVKKHSKVWSMDDELMHEVCDLAYKITGDPEKYRRHKEENWGRSTDELTKDIAQILHDRHINFMSESKDIYLQITNTESAYKSSKINDNDVAVKHRQWKFTAIDGDKSSITLRLDSTLNTAGNVLTPGTVIHVKRYLPIYWKYDDNIQKKCAIVVREFEVVGRQQVPPENANQPPKQRVKPKAAQKISKRKKLSKKEEDGTTAAVACDGSCSCHGVEFRICLTVCVPVSSISLAIVARECVFATRSVEDMSPSDKRFLCYYYYATSIYQFHGKGNRVELPECVKRAVRSKYLNEQTTALENEN